MHIKKIIIQGFKTYKNTTVIDFLSPQHNVVVGRNGSGKSNFFAAIRFVLSDAYTHMTREERQGLIHEGSGTVMSAYVEIVFDNTERRFPIAKDEVSVRRTIGLKKDDYSLDSKSASRSDVMNLLESAGFSRSNPYYIVPQGRITALTNSKDSERLTLLKEVSGARVFETKLKESMKEMTNSNYKKQRIDETLKSIEERLSDLQIESADLKEYQSLEKSKKVLEFNIFDRELNDLNSQVETINFNYDQLLSESQADLEELDKREKLCKELSESINDLTLSLKVSKLEKDQTDLDYNQILTTLSDKKMRLNEVEASLSGTKEQSTSLQASIDHYTSLIAKKEREISENKPGLESLQDVESQTKADLAEYTSKQRALYSKQSRFSKFQTKEQRDEWLNKEISSVTKELNKKSNTVTKLEQEIDSKQVELEDLKEQISKLNDSILGPNFAESVKSLQYKISDSKAQITELTDHRKSLWRDEIRLRSIQDSISNDLNNATHLVNQTMDRAQAQGLAAVKSITDQLNLQESVLGPLAELFHVNDKYKTAVEVIAGNSLFHVVVDNDKTASLLMSELVRTKAGRVTFMPLNRLNPGGVNYPDSTEHECIPLLKKIKFDDQRVLPALKQVFGRTVMTVNLEKGSELARNFNVNCITLDGDRADSRGVLTGGFRDNKKSRIDALKVQKKKKSELVSNNDSLAKCVEEIESINPKLTALNNELQASVRELDKKYSSQEPIKAEISRLSDLKFNIIQEIDSITSNLNTSREFQENLKSNLNQHTLELSSDFTQSLSEDELSQLQKLTVDISRTENILDDVVMKLTEIETKNSQYQAELLDNYYPYLAKLQKEQSESHLQVPETEITDLQREIKTISAQLEAAKDQNQEAISQYEKLEKEVQKNEEFLKKSSKQQALIVKKLEKFSETTEKQLSKKSFLIIRRDEVQKKIRDLGVLPEEAFQQDKHDQFTAQELLEKLNKVNEKLLDYSHINKKAMEQYNTFTRQRDDLAERREELEKSRESIEVLISDLESQKDAAISKSFKQVAESFTKIFEKLVPAGTGRLIMQKQQQDENSNTQEEGVDIYSGVSISVSFNSKEDEQQRIEQLSGGQKSLCAITLILAIQSCDPAPFYLFDEVDANLDTQYRTSVAAMIHSLSANAQFICTTFRPEMLQVADKFYGVMFNNKVSTVSEIVREEAMSFVEGQEQR
ncbi:structural maintenance of chromosomes protein 3 [[Candida] anglica]